MVRDLMLAAYDAGMTQGNEYVFIIIPTNYFPLYSWKAADDDLFYDMSQKNRDEDARKAFQVGINFNKYFRTTHPFEFDIEICTTKLNLDRVGTSRHSTV